MILKYLTFLLVSPPAASQRARPREPPALRPARGQRHQHNCAQHHQHRGGQYHQHNRAQCHKDRHDQDGHSVRHCNDNALCYDCVMIV